MAAKKSKQELEQIKNHVSKLYLQGFTFFGMENWIKANTGLSISRKMCSTYVKEMLDEWHFERIDDVDKWITAELKGLNDVEREAWAAWEKSKQDKTKSVTRKRGKLPAGKSQTITTTNVENYDEVTSGTGDPRYLEIIKDCKLQRLQYLTKGTFGKEDNNTNVYMQQVIEIGVVERLPPKDYPTTLEVEAQ